MTKTLGMKFDTEKPRMGLLPPYALESVADVLTFGAKKYLPNNWKYVENGTERYLDASLRHINAYIKGEKNDKESGLPHLSHALCCLMFIVDLELAKQDRTTALHKAMNDSIVGMNNLTSVPLSTQPVGVAAGLDTVTVKVNPKYDYPNWPLGKTDGSVSTNKPYSLAEVMQFWKDSK